jgi:hypothetical protein
VKNWSFAYEVKQEELADDLARNLMEVDLLEIGPTLVGANSETRTLALKEAPMVEIVERKAVDDSAWDGSRAMGECDTAADYREIAFERANDSDPDSAAHWALPHHYLGKGPNAQGVSAAVAALNGARGGSPDLKSAGVARSHLEGHRSQINPEKSSASVDLKLDAAVAAELMRFEGDVDALIEAKIGRAISAKTEAKIRAALAALEQILSSDGEEMPSEQASSTPAVKSPEEGPIGENELLRLALTDAGVFLAERTA